MQTTLSHVIARRSFGCHIQFSSIVASNVSIYPSPKTPILGFRSISIPSTAARTMSVQGPSTTTTVSSAPEAQLNRKRQPHWANDTATLFRNPWPSFRSTGFTDVAKLLFSGGASPDAATTAKSVKNIPVRKPDFGASLASEDGKIKATWLGHACFLLEMPLPPTSTSDVNAADQDSKQPRRGVRILLDPVFSHRCSPSSWVGPARFTEAPCQADELPEIDVVSPMNK